MHPDMTQTTTFIHEGHRGDKWGEAERVGGLMGGRQGGKEMGLIGRDGAESDEHGEDKETE